MLHNELLTTLGKGLDEIKRSGEGLLVSAKAKKDQRRFQTSMRA
jgi:hypothetical protein